jgi:hypothetical protein
VFVDVGVSEVFQRGISKANVLTADRIEFNGEE